jgi:putative tricarboxylic transport membrane protein
MWNIFFKKNVLTLMIFLLGIALFFVIPMSIRSIPNSSGAVGPRGFPYFCAACVVLSSLCTLATSIFSMLRKPRRQEDAATNQNFAKGRVARVLILLAALMLWYLLLFRIGFIITTSLLLFAAMMLWGNRRPVQLIVTPLAFSFGVFFIFQKLLYVPLPSLFL